MNNIQTENTQSQGHDSEEDCNEEVFDNKIDQIRYQ